MNRTAFFAELRKRDSGVFGTSLSQKQVEGIEAILDAARDLDAPSVAYVLATAYWETGRSMYPNEENMNYSSGARVAKIFGSHRRQGLAPSQLARNPKLLACTVYGGDWGKKNLGNIIGTSDGYDYRGRGIDHCTGRANYIKAGNAVGLDLLSNPELLLQPDIAAKVAVTGMISGRYRPGHRLARYIKPGAVDFVGARKIINADNNGPQIAAYARAFLSALEVAGWAAGAPLAPSPAPTPTKPEQSGWWGILGALAAAFRGFKR